MVGRSCICSPGITWFVHACKLGDSRVCTCKLGILGFVSACSSLICCKITYGAQALHDLIVYDLILDHLFQYKFR